MRSLLYLTGRTPSPFPTEPEHYVNVPSNGRCHCGEETLSIQTKLTDSALVVCPILLTSPRTSLERGYVLQNYKTAAITANVSLNARTSTRKVLSSFQGSLNRFHRPFAFSISPLACGSTSNLIRRMMGSVRIGARRVILNFTGQKIERAM